MMSALLPYLQLCRLPTVFTAMADIFLGYLLVHEGLGVTFGFLLAASSCLYLSGMVWNDVFDRDVDAVERPNRPIPSGRVDLRRAKWLGSGLMLAGVVLAVLASVTSLIVAVLLVAAIFLYDKSLKRTFLGPVAMGSCRFLNVLLGASSLSGKYDALLSSSPLWVASGLGLYIIGVTWFARTEARESQRGQLIGAMVVVNVGLATLIGWIANSPGDRREAVLLAMVVIGLTINRRLIAAIAEPIPQRVQSSIRTMLLSIIVLDATLIAHRLGSDGTVYALVTVALLIPAMTVGRWIRMT